MLGDVFEVLLVLPRDLVDLDDRLLDLVFEVVVEPELVVRPD